MVRTTQISLNALQNWSHQANQHRSFFTESDPPSIFLATFFLGIRGPKSTCKLWPHFFVTKSKPQLQHITKYTPCLTLPEQRCRMDTRFCKDVYFHLSCSALDSIKKNFCVTTLFEVSGPTFCKTLVNQISYTATPVQCCPHPIQQVFFDIFCLYIYISFSGFAPKS